MKAIFKFIIILILIIITISNLSAKIVYKEVDTTVSVLTPSAQYMLDIDLNKDGINDFYIAHNYYSNGVYSDRYVDIFTDYISDIYLNKEHAVIPMEPDIDISKDLCHWNTQGGTGMQFDAGWFGEGFKYIGIRFKIKNVFHYGWLRVSIPSDTSGFTLKDFAYEDTPGASIKSGNDGKTDVFDPKESSVFKLLTNGREIRVQFQQEFAYPVDLELYDVLGNCASMFNNIISGQSYYLNITGGIYLARIKCLDKSYHERLVMIE